MGTRTGPNDAERAEFLRASKARRLTHALADELGEEELDILANALRDREGDLNVLVARLRAGGFPVVADNMHRTASVLGLLGVTVWQALRRQQGIASDDDDIVESLLRTYGAPSLTDEPETVDTLDAYVAGVVERHLAAQSTAGKTLYALYIQDTHSDVEVQLFTTASGAIKAGRAMAQGYARGNPIDDRTAQTASAGWLLNLWYTPESHLSVREVKIEA